MDLYSIRNQRISPNEEFPLLCFRSARLCVALLARSAAYRKKGFKKVDSVTKRAFLECATSFLIFYLQKSLSHMLPANDNWYFRVIRAPPLLSVFSLPSFRNKHFVCLILLNPVPPQTRQITHRVYFLKRKSSLSLLEKAASSFHVYAKMRLRS